MSEHERPWRDQYGQTKWGLAVMLGYELIGWIVAIACLVGILASVGWFDHSGGGYLIWSCILGVALGAVGIYAGYRIYLDVEYGRTERNRRPQPSALFDRGQGR